MAKVPSGNSGSSLSIGSEDQEYSSGRFRLSNKLKEKLDKLAPWRIDPSLIAFPDDPCEFHGGNAAVAQAFLASLSDDEDSRDDSQRSSEEPSGLDGLILKFDDTTVGSGHDGPDKEGHQESEPDEGDHDKNKDGEEVQRNDGQPGLEDEGQKPESDDESPSLTVIAVKKLKIADDTDVERVLGLALRETELLVELSHPNIVEVLGFVEEVTKDIVWLVFPWEGNGNLRDFLASSDWEIPERISLIDDVTQGVEYLHQQDPPIFHGDLKSLNILVTSERYAVITDFGSARRLKNGNLDGTTHEDISEPRLAGSPTTQGGSPLQVTFCTSTKTITLTGNNYTLRWAAPELLMEDHADLRSDIWSLGWIYYEAMTNSIPFQDVLADIVVVTRVVQGDLPSITNDIRVSSITALCSLMAQCWNIIPSERPTAKECRSSIGWMPMVVPSPRETSGSKAQEPLSPTLFLTLGSLHIQQDNYPKALNAYLKALSVYTAKGDARGRANTLCGLGDVQRCQDQYGDSASNFSEALSIYGELGDNDGKATALRGLGQLHTLQQKYDAAISSFSQAIQIYTDLQDSGGRADTLCHLAEVQVFQDKYSDAFSNYSEARSIFADIDDRSQTARALCGLGNVHRCRDDYVEAISCYSEALNLYTADGNDSGRADASYGLGMVRAIRNDLSEAVSCYSKVIQLRTMIGDASGGAAALCSLGQAYGMQENYDEAISKYSEALQIYTDIGDRSGRAEALAGLADLYRCQDQYTQALTHYSEALQISIDISDKGGQADALCGFANVYSNQEQYDDALSHFNKALTIRTDIGDLSGQADVLENLAEVYHVQEQYEDAILHHSQALQLRSDIGDTSGRAKSLCNLAEVYYNQGEYDDATARYSEALQIRWDRGDAEGRADVFQSLAAVYRDQIDLAIPCIMQKRQQKSLPKLATRRRKLVLQRT